MITDILFHNPRIQENRVALQEKDEQITYGQLQQKIRQFAGYLISQGSKPKEKILVWQNNSIHQIVSFFAVNLIGGICVFADTKFKQEMIDIIEENNVKLVVTSSLQAANLYCQNKVKIIRVDELSLTDAQEENLVVYLERLKADKSWLSTVLYTSGSTGKPKGVLNTHENLEEALKNYAETMNFTCEDIFIGVTPFFHSYAFDSCMLVALFHGSTLILMDHFVPGRVLTAIQEKKATVIHAVPFMYALMIEQLKARQYDVSSLRILVSAGSKLEEEILREFYRLTGKVISQEYGSTETGTIAINLSNHVETAVKYVGKPLCNVSIKLVPFEETEETVLTVISKGMAIGYLGEEPFDRSGYSTKDLGVIEDGYIWIQGRVDRLINITGLKVNPVEVETCLKNHPDIEDAFVKGVKSEHFGQMVEAVLVKKREDLTKEEVAAYCKEHLAAFKVPSIITWEKKLVKSGLGKARYQ